MNSIAAWAQTHTGKDNTLWTRPDARIRPSAWSAKWQRCRPRLRLLCSRMPALICLCLLMLLSACASPPIVHTVPVTKTVRQWVPVPAERVAPLAVPRPPPSMLWGEALTLNAALYGALEQCQADRTELRRLNDHIQSQNENQ